jgi:hypothetical protein
MYGAVVGKYTGGREGPRDILVAAEGDVRRRAGDRCEAHVVIHGAEYPRDRFADVDIEDVRCEQLRRRGGNAWTGRRGVGRFIIPTPG